MCPLHTYTHTHTIHQNKCMHSHIYVHIRYIHTYTHTCREREHLQDALGVENLLGSKRDLFIWQKRPIHMAKETYSYGKRDLFIGQKKLEKEAATHLRLVYPLLL